MSLLTTEDLAARWQTTIERVLRRVRDSNIPAINIGTKNNPEIRYPLKAIEAWELAAQKPVNDAPVDKRRS